MLRQGLQTAIRTLYPPDCLACGAFAESEHGLCGPCFRDCHFLSNLVCDRCGIQLPGDKRDDIVLCDTCLTTGRGWTRGRAALSYEGTGRKLVLALKHADRHDLVRPVSKWMAAVTPPQRDDTLVVPVPLHWTRLLRRRYNQSALLAQRVACELGLTYAPDALKRRKPTEVLDGKSREQRFQILSDVMVPKPSQTTVLEGRPVLLVDDVMTSGATLSACAAACVTAGARNVDVVVLARVAQPT